MDDELLARMRRYAPVLETMIEILGADPSRKRVSFGTALEQAMWKHGFCSLPPDVEQAMLTSAFKIFAQGGLPGAPEA